MLLVAERRGRLVDAAVTMHDLLRDFSVTVIESAQIVSEIAFARKYQLSVYDAAYLALAVVEKAPLATLDARLARAAAAEGYFFTP